MKIETTPRGLLTVLFRQKTKFLVTFCLVVMASTCLALFSVPSYKSTGTLLVRFGDSSMPDMIGANRKSAPPVSQTSHELIDSYVEVLQSRRLLLSLIDKFGATHIYPQLAGEHLTHSALTEAAIKELRHDLAIKSSDENDVIEISLANPDPGLAAQLVHHMQETFIALQTEVYNKPATDFLREEVQQSKKQLDNDQEKLQTFKAKSGISSPDTEIPALLAEQNAMKTSAVTASLTSELASVKEAQDKVDQLEARKAELLTTYKPESPQVQQVTSRIAFAEYQLRDRQTELGARNAHTGASAQGSAEIIRRISHLEAQRNEYNNLTRQVQMDADNYKNYLSQLEEAKISNKLNQQNITRIFILDEPSAASKPAKPVKLLIVAFGIIAGMVFGLGMMLAAEAMDERFVHQEQLSALLKAPAIAIAALALNKPSKVPLLANRNKSSNALMRNDSSATTLISPALPVSNLIELYEMIKTAAPSQSSHVIQFCSAYHHEGASLIAFDMAVMVAIRTKLRVLFVDTSTNPNGVRRHLAEAVNAMPDAPLKRPNAFGFASAPMAIGNNLTYVMLRNYDHMSKAALSNGEVLSELIGDWRRAYDLIVIPSPSVLSDILGKTLIKVTDGSVVVVESERTRAPVVMQLRNTIESNGGQVLCAILNKRRLYIPTSVYRRL